MIRRVLFDADRHRLGEFNNYCVSYRVRPRDPPGLTLQPLFRESRPALRFRRAIRREAVCDEIYCRSVVALPGLPFLIEPSLPAYIRDSATSVPCEEGRIFVLGVRVARNGRVLSY